MFAALLASSRSQVVLSPLDDRLQADGRRGTVGQLQTLGIDCFQVSLHRTR
jgi:hypothetical protein